MKTLIATARQLHQIRTPLGVPWKVHGKAGQADKGKKARFTGSLGEMLSSSFSLCIVFRVYTAEQKAVGFKNKETIKLFWGSATQLKPLVPTEI